MVHCKARLKQVRQDKFRTLRNKSNKSEMKTLEKTFRSLVESGDSEVATQALSAAFSKLDKMAKGGIIHANKANRKKARLAAVLKTTVA